MIESTERALKRLRNAPAREADLKQAAVVLASLAWHAATRAEKMPRPR